MEFSKDRVVVTTRAFSNNMTLRDELLKFFPDSKFNEDGLKLEGQQLIDFIKDADRLIIGLERIDEAVLKQCPRLKIIAKYGVGLDNIDIQACKDNNVEIGWRGGVNSISVAEMALGFMLALSRNLFFTSNLLKNNTWLKDGGRQLSGKTIGIIGLGNIGRELVRLLEPFNCNILANDIVDVSEFALKNNIKMVDKTSIYTECDVISIHTPLTEKTNGLINKDVFSVMKESSIIINTARGGIIDETSLAEALSSKRIAGAAIDVYFEEPPQNAALISLPNLICTPHIGGNAKEAVLAMGFSAINHLVKFNDLK